MPDPIADGERVYRSFALPVASFDILKGLQRQWGFDSNGAVVNHLLETAGRTMLDPRFLSRAPVRFPLK